MRNQLGYYARRALTSPREVTLERVAQAATTAARDLLSRRRDRTRDTFGTIDPGAEPLARILTFPDLKSLHPVKAGLVAVAKLYLDHRFDLLGSGWVTVYPGMEARGFEGHRYPRHAPETDSADDSVGSTAARIRELIDDGYRPIDWQIDFKSGFRWDERTWFGDLRYGHVPGADIKVPWELARLQHLPQLAIAAAINDGTEDPAPRACAAEFRNQVLDFVAGNPPRFGVCWGNAMEAGIRVTNLLVAYDLFRAQGIQFDRAFEVRLRAAVEDHVSFIASNLEWSKAARGNHFLAGLAGLIVACSYLGPRRAHLLTAATAQLVEEIHVQFHPEGSNFEGSTSYHRFAAEMVLYAACFAGAAGALEDRAVTDRCLISRHGRRLPSVALTNGAQELHEQLTRIASFTEATIKVGGRSPQIGDNDSGRFLKLIPAWNVLPIEEARRSFPHLGASPLLSDGTILVEDHLDHRHLVAALAGIRSALDEVGGPHRFEADLVHSLWAHRSDDVPGSSVPFVGTPPASAGTNRRVTWIFKVPPGGDLRDGLEHASFVDFGLFVFRSKRLYLSIRCGPVGQRGRGGHAHNDQLAIELDIDGDPWISDPGSFVYTALPERRNAYRSVTAHFTPTQDGKEQAPLDRGLFRLPERARARCTTFGECRFVGHHLAYGRPTTRTVDIQADEIVIVDELPADDPSEETFEMTSPAELQGPVDAVPYSPGYGVVQITPPGPQNATP